MSLPGPVRRRCDAVYVAKGGVLQTAASITAFLVGCEVEPDDRIIQTYLAGGILSGGLPKDRHRTNQNNNNNNNSPKSELKALTTGSSPRGGPVPLDTAPPTSARLRLKPTAIAAGQSSHSLTTARRLQKPNVSIEAIAETSMTSMPSLAQQPASPSSPVLRPSALLGPARISLDDCYLLVKECLIAQDRKQIVGNDEQLFTLAWSSFSGSSTMEGTARATDFESQIQSFGLRCGPIAGSGPGTRPGSPTVGTPEYGRSGDPTDYDGPMMNFDDMISMVTIDKDILRAVSTATSMVSLPTSLLRTLTAEEQHKAHRLAKALYRLKLMLRTTVAFRRANKSFERAFSSPVLMAPLPSSGRLKALRDQGGVNGGGVHEGGGNSPYRRVQTREERTATIRRLSLFDHDAVGTRCRKHSHSHSVAENFSPSRGRSPVSPQRGRSPVEHSSSGSPQQSPNKPQSVATYSAWVQFCQTRSGLHSRAGSLLPPLEHDRRSHDTIVAKLQQQNGSLSTITALNILHLGYCLLATMSGTKH